MDGAIVIPQTAMQGERSAQQAQESRRLVRGGACRREAAPKAAREWDEFPEAAPGRGSFAPGARYPPACDAIKRRAPTRPRLARGRRTWVVPRDPRPRMARVFVLQTVFFFDASNIWASIWN